MSGPDLSEWRRLVGTWTTESTYSGLPGTVVSGQTSFEWLDDQQVLLQRAHYDHPQIPDALAVLGIVDGEPAMHYFDVRGVHRTFGVEITAGTWRYWNAAPGFAQRFTGTTGAGGDVIEGRGELSRDDGATWEPDVAMTYRRR